MNIDVITLFPEMVEQVLSYSIPGRAQKSELVTLRTQMLRQWAIDNHGTVDDAPYGGGPGMVMRVDVAHSALEAIDPKHTGYRIMLSPDGEQLTQELVKKLALKKSLVLLCGRYEGFDARIEKYVDLKLSIGPYVLSGGELPAMLLCDAVIRLQEGVLGNLNSLKDETFEEGLTEYPQYTRPETYDNQSVPEILLSGHHAEIEKWRQSQRKPVKSFTD